MPVIAFFSSRYFFLANVWKQDFEYDERTFNSAEHAYWFAKARTDSDRARVLYAKNPQDARRIGLYLPYNPEFEEDHENILYDILTAKFKVPGLQQALLGTKDALLINGNYYHDNLWGVCYCQECPNYGENRLGEFLMLIRKYYTK